MANLCPAGAPKGSKWTIVGGKFQCLGPDGTIVPSGNATGPTITPGGVGGAPGIARPALGSGYTSVPGGMGGGGGSGIGMGGGGIGAGGSGGKQIPWWVSGGLTLLGGILKAKGKQKQINEAKQEAARLEAEDRARAKGRAALIRGILNANGYGSLMTDDQILAMVTKTGARPNTAGAITSDIGGAALGIGSNLLLDTYTRNRDQRTETRPATASVGSSLPGSANPGTGTATADDSSKEFWDDWTRQFYEELEQNIHQNPYLGG